VQTRKGGEGELELASTELGTRASTERESERGRALSRIQFPSVSSLVFRSSSLRIIEIAVGQRFGAVSMLGLRKENQRVRVRSEEERDRGGGRQYESSRVEPGNACRKGKLSMVDLLFKVAQFVQ